MYLNYFQQNLHLDHLFFLQFAVLYYKEPARHEAKHSKIIQILPFQMFLIQRLEPGRVSPCMDLPLPRAWKDDCSFPVLPPDHTRTSCLPHSTEWIWLYLLRTRLCLPALNLPQLKKRATNLVRVQQIAITAKH